jgi:tetratricopeptide (TPR) repeat protein
MPYWTDSDSLSFFVLTFCLVPSRRHRGIQTMILAAEFDRAFRLHQQGKLREAFLRYDAILKAEPRHAPALHYSGVVLHQSGILAPAVERIKASLAIDPASPEAWSDLAAAQMSLSLHADAEASARRAIAGDPKHAAAWYQLALALQLEGRLREALDSARRAAGITPSSARYSALQAQLERLQPDIGDRPASR